MKVILKSFLLLCLLAQLPVFAYSEVNDKREVEAVIQQYIDGTSAGNPKLIESAFHPDASLILSHPKKSFWQIPAKEYSSWFKSPKSNRSGHILSIYLDNDIATARALITTEKPLKQYVDQFLLKRFATGWQIVSKTATQIAVQQEQEQIKSAMNKRVLFIASSAEYHGESELATGTSFSELVDAYDVFINAGYRVDFVSTKGGKLPLAYINTSNPKDKKFIYNPDLMYLLANTMSPEEVNPSHYLAVHYLGGGNAMYQVAENEVLQRISMHIYEQNNGIVSSVCHGTAGIVNLKLSNGEYLVSGRNITGYPTAFEKTDAAYYKQFPFAIEETIRKRGGKFFHGERNQSFVKVDGNLITGTNYQSSKDVALAMVAKMNEM